MAESMSGMKRTHRCAELSKDSGWTDCHSDGLGTKEQK